MTEDSMTGESMADPQDQETGAVPPQRAAEAREVVQVA